MIEAVVRFMAAHVKRVDYGIGFEVSSIPRLIDHVHGLAKRGAELDLARQRAERGAPIHDAALLHVVLIGVERLVDGDAHDRLLQELRPWLWLHA